MFQRISNSGNFAATAISKDEISLYYRDAEQAAVLSVASSSWLAGAISNWAQHSGHFNFYVKSPEGDLVVIAEDDLRGFIWYFPLDQGTWLPRSDILWLRDTINLWKEHYHV